MYNVYRNGIVYKENLTKEEAQETSKRLNTNKKSRDRYSDAYKAKYTVKEVKNI